MRTPPAHARDSAGRVLEVLTHRRFRSGPRPAEPVRRLVLDRIDRAIARRQALGVLLFWGGCKNPNLPVRVADGCEEATFDYLLELHRDVCRIHPPGLRVFVAPGDERVHRANGIPRHDTEAYVRSLTSLADRHGGVFTVVPVSSLYRRHADRFQACLADVNRRVPVDLDEDPSFETLVANAERNVYCRPQPSWPGLGSRARQAARDYVVLRLAEEEAGIFGEYKDCVRASFARLTPFVSVYRRLSRVLDQVEPRLDCVLHLYTGGKGNITQPWQAVATRRDGHLVFASQRKLAVESGRRPDPRT